MAKPSPEVSGYEPSLGDDLSIYFSHDHDNESYWKITEFHQSNMCFSNIDYQVLEPWTFIKMFTKEQFM